MKRTATLATSETLKKKLKIHLFYHLLISLNKHQFTHASLCTHTDDIIIFFAKLKALVNEQLNPPDKNNSMKKMKAKVCKLLFEIILSVAAVEAGDLYQIIMCNASNYHGNYYEMWHFF